VRFVNSASMPPRRSMLLATTVAAALLASPLTAGPSYAGFACDLDLDLDDCEAPETVLTAMPEAETSQSAAGFEFTTEVPEGRVTFECKLEGPSQAHDWTDCTDPAFPLAAESTGSRAYTGLTVGLYTFHVRATDGFLLGPNTEDPAKLWSWQVEAADPGTDPDEEAPDTILTSVPRRWHLTPYAGINYTGDEQLVDADCRLDGTEYRCSSRQAVIPNMGPGDHALTVAGIDTEGNVDPTPAVSEWTLPYQVRALHFSGGWKKKRGDGYFQESYAVTRKRGATVHMSRPSYRAVALVATRCPGCGRVEVRQGSRVLDRINLDAPRVRKRQTLQLGSWVRPRGGRLTVEVLTQGKNVTVEGMGFSARR